jgi:hypothetical protein
MNYTLEWAPLAVEELAAAWLSSPDQAELSRTVDLVERALADSPFEVGEAYGASVQRILVTPTIGLGYYIVEDDKKVIVQSCWRVG